MSRVRRSLRSLIIMGMAVSAAFSAVCVRPATARASDSSEQAEYFEQHIRPVLHSRCIKCHGENKQEAGLRLDTSEAMLKGGDSGPAVLPGKPEDSLLLEAVRYESLEMPPDGRLTEDQVARLDRWIRDGAVWPAHDGKSVRLQGAVFTEEDRNFWSLQPIAHPTPPASVKGVRNAVDAFVFARLTEASLEPAPRARDDVLLRRLWFDLLGVPPSPHDMDQYSGRLSPSQWSLLVDRLLDDSRYGEHWARYWLDIVRYAESDGFRADFYRPDAWRYRDYIVSAFNSDKPYNQFVAEQLAGDEIAPERAEALIATGFLRTYLYEYNQRDARTQWQDILNQVTDVTGEVFLGIGVGCARCHDHKFDPILQEDYFRLQACFATMMPRDDIPAADIDERQRYEARYSAWLAKEAALRSELAALREPWDRRAARGAIERFPQDIQDIMAKAPQDRTPLESQLADLVNRQIEFDRDRQKIKDEDRKRIEELEKQITGLAGNPPAKLPTAITVADVGPLPQEIHIGADAHRKTIRAGGFTILSPSEFTLQPTRTSTGQRTALADWITDPANPLTARVIVNRIWQQHFGTGLVTTASDFGSLGGRPSHPELLDWLASEFVANGWSIKWLHRQILNSATWQMSAFHPDAAGAERVDPANRLRWRFDIRRLTAEQIRDAMLTVSGELMSEQGGPSVEHKSLRRSLYLKAMRNTPEPLLKSLDGVDGLNSIPKRSTTTTPTQALNLMNGKWVRARSTAAARRLLEERGHEDISGLLDAAFRTTLGRRADKDELVGARAFLAEAGAFRDSARTDEVREPLITSAGRAVKLSDEIGLSPLRTSGPEPAVAAPFTFMGIIRLDRLYADASVRTIISQWNGSNSTGGWSIGITSEKSRYQPRNFILQVVSNAGYEVVASNLRPEPGKTYLAAVTIEQSDSEPESGDASGEGEAVATFYLKEYELAAPEQEIEHPLQTAEVRFKSTEGMTGKFPVVVGGRMDGTKLSSRQRWAGQLDQVALFDRALNIPDVEELFAGVLNSTVVAQKSPLAFWNFDEASDLSTDMAASPHPLAADPLHLPDPMEQALADFCHVLINSNEFVYID